MSVHGQLGCGPEVAWGPGKEKALTTDDQVTRSFKDYSRTTTARRRPRRRGGGRVTTRWSRSTAWPRIQGMRQSPTERTGPCTNERGGPRYSSSSSRLEPGYARQGRALATHHAAETPAVFVADGGGAGSRSGGRPTSVSVLAVPRTHSAAPVLGNFTSNPFLPNSPRDDQTRSGIIASLVGSP